MIPDDILQVAAVVTGEERIHLVGWQRIHAIAAMAALGYSRRHIAWALDSSTTRVNQIALTNNITMHSHDQRPDDLAVAMVCAGYRMRLTGVDRDEAIRRLAANRVTCERIAHLLKTKPSTISRTASRIDVRLPKPRRPWWDSVAAPSVHAPDRRNRRVVAA